MHLTQRACTSNNNSGDSQLRKSTASPALVGRQGSLLAVCLFHLDRLTIRPLAANANYYDRSYIRTWDDERSLAYVRTLDNDLVELYCLRESPRSISSPLLYIVFSKKIPLYTSYLNNIIIYILFCIHNYLFYSRFMYICICHSLECFIVHTSLDYIISVFEYLFTSLFLN